MLVYTPHGYHIFFFADDCIVFTEASQRGGGRLQGILETYSRGSRQLVNKEKSTVFFSENCTGQMKEEVQESLQIEKKALAEKYLGLPTALGRSTKEAFEYMPT